MLPEGWLGCGQDDHAPECLCDVVIPDGTDTSIQVTDAVNMMWMGREVCDLRGYCAPWTNETILDYFTDLTRFYDVWAQSGHNDITDGEPVALHQVPQTVDRNSMYPQARWKSIRDAVMYCMNRFDNGLAEILQHFGLTPSEFAEAATCGKTLNVSYKDIQWWEEMFMNPDITLEQISQDTGMTINSVRGLVKYWRSRRERSSSFCEKTADELAIARTYRHLCLETDLNSTEIRDIMLREHGKTYDKSTISKFRKRNGYTRSQ